MQSLIYPEKIRKIQPAGWGVSSNYVGNEVILTDVFAIGPFSRSRDKNLAAEATPWLQPRCHRMAVASGHAMTLRFKAGRALDAQEAVPDLFGDGRPSNAD